MFIGLAFVCSSWEVNLTSSFTCKPIGSWRTSCLQMAYTLWLTLDVSTPMSWPTCLGIYRTLRSLLCYLLCTKFKKLEEDQIYDVAINQGACYITLVHTPHSLLDDESSEKVPIPFWSHYYDSLFLSVCLGRYLYEYKAMDAA